MFIVFQENHLKKINLLNSKGFTLVEMLIASAIMSVVVFGGFQAYTYFNQQTVKEAKKMDDISEFNLLTKDLLNFSEGAGISTFFLNLPIKAKDCVDDKPCVRQLVGQNFKNPTVSLPTGLTANECVQFYKDAKGTLDSKAAYPGKTAKDKIWETKDLLLSGDQELYATWILKDETSPPFMMVKSRDSSIYLSLITQNLMTDISTPKALKHAFFESNSPQDAITQLKGYPVLIYNSQVGSIYNIQFAEEIISCNQDRQACINLMKILYVEAPTQDDTTLSGNLIAKFPTNVYAIKFKPMDFQAPFFKQILDRQNLTPNCLSSWGNGTQPSSGYFFPSSVLSVSPDASETDSNIGSNPINLIYLPKDAYKKLGGNSAKKGIYVALPIDIVTYKAEVDATSGALQLVSELWHPTEIKKKIKIHNLKSPFMFTRKLGSPEMGIWYNPIKKNQ